MNKKILILTNKGFVNTGYFIEEQLLKLDPELQITKVHYNRSGSYLVSEEWDVIINASCFNKKFIDNKFKGLKNKAIVFNSPDKTKIINSKYNFYEALHNEFNLIPTTLDYTTLSYPYIAKYSRGGNGKSIAKIESEADRLAFVEKIREKLAPRYEIKENTIIYQPFITSSLGKDVRVVMIGGKVACAILRESQEENEYRSNISLGGVGSKYNLTKEDITLCENIAAKLGLDYFGLDLMFGKNGQWLISEANATALMNKKMCEYAEFDIAKAYAEYIYNKIK